MCIRDSGIPCDKLRVKSSYAEFYIRNIIEVGFYGTHKVTRERIRQIEAKALRKLRHPSRSRKLKDSID